MSLPLVIVTGPDKTFPFAWWATRFMLRLVGLNAFYLSPKSQYIPEGARGVIIGGGDDIDPEHYGLTGDAGARYDLERDRLEMSMVREALGANVPLLGICRGEQLINVVMGGSLHIDLRPHRRKTPNRNSIFPIKKIDVVEDSCLYDTIEKPSLSVNSLHNQAVDQVAEGLQASAYDRDGFIQAIESRGDRFIRGVQWHPEYMPYSLNQKRLFRSFASAVRSSQAVLASQPVEMS